MKRLVALLAALVTVGVCSVALAAGTPTATTGTASSPTNSSATVNGTVNPNGQATTYEFQYGTTTSYGQQTQPTSAGSGTTAQNVSASLSNLRPGTMYHFRLVATNASGTVAGADATFTTTGTAPAASTPPAVVTSAATATKRNGATLNGTVNPKGSATTYTFEYGLTRFYGTETTAKPVPAGSAAVPVSQTLRGLQAGETYHYRLVASNVGGTTVGTDRTFRTGPARSTTTLTARTNPKSARSLPHTFVTSGKLVPPAHLNTRRACKGTVQVVFTKGKNVVSRKNARLNTGCRYRSSAKVNAHGAKSLKVSARFTGNATVRQTKARTQTIKIG